MLLLLLLQQPLLQLLLLLLLYLFGSLLLQLQLLLLRELSGRLPDARLRVKPHPWLLLIHRWWLVTMTRRYRCGTQLKNYIVRKY